VFVASTPIVAHRCRHTRGKSKWGRQLCQSQALSRAVSTPRSARLRPGLESGFQSGFLRTYSVTQQERDSTGYGIAFDTILVIPGDRRRRRVPGLVHSCTSTFPFTTITEGAVLRLRLSLTRFPGGFPTVLGNANEEAVVALYAA